MTTPLRLTLILAVASIAACKTSDNANLDIGGGGQNTPCAACTWLPEDGNLVLRMWGVNPSGYPLPLKDAVVYVWYNDAGVIIKAQVNLSNAPSQYDVDKVYNIKTATGRFNYSNIVRACIQWKGSNLGAAQEYPDSKSAELLFCDKASSSAKCKWENANSGECADLIP